MLRVALETKLEGILRDFLIHDALGRFVADFFTHRIFTANDFQFFVVERMEIQQFIDIFHEFLVQVIEHFGVGVGAKTA